MGKNNSTLDINALGETSLQERLSLVWKLSLPGILAQISEIAMQYIDAAMVGSLGAAASASIGLVASSTWLMGGLIQGSAAGFYVQIAHSIGARDEKKARKILHNGYAITGLVSLVLCLIGVILSRYLPIWLGGSQDIVSDASAYFLCYSLFIPARMLFFGFDVRAGCAVQCAADLSFALYRKGICDRSRHGCCWSGVRNGAGVCVCRDHAGNCRQSEITGIEIPERGREKA